MVKIFTRRGCSPCATLKYVLDKRGIEYDLQDIDEHPDPSITMVPTIIINGEIIRGLNLPQIVRLLGAEKV
jgi:glutaredoxin